ncbi:type II restriction endonuclease [Actinomycetota bacterium]|nr:type II restriction endonuclease [Actinomycetota bacterium]
MNLFDWIVDAQTYGKFITAKRLSANDTGATGANQAGPYVTRSVVDQLFPEIHHRRDTVNPKITIQSSFSSPVAETQNVTLTWYNNKFRDRTRNEFRLTGWGGQTSPIQSLESTGSLVLFAFSRNSEAEHVCDLWLCHDIFEEEIAERALGIVEPGTMVMLFSPSGSASPIEDTLDSFSLPVAWEGRWPTGEELVRESVLRVPGKGIEIDKLLIDRRETERELYRQVENIMILADVQERSKDGFNSVDDFVRFANPITNRRMSRSGKSLELHVMNLLQGEGLHFEYDQKIEGDKRPDFLFPSVHAYEDPSTPPIKLSMLAVKTTIKDRWRQILQEAGRIPTKHLLTLQEGVSPTQYAQIKEAQVVLVVPKPLHSKYPKSFRSELVTVKDFVDYIKNLEVSACA